MGHFPVQAQVGLEEKYSTIGHPLKCHLQSTHSSGFHAEDTSPLVERPAVKWSCPRPPVAGLAKGW